MSDEIIRIKSISQLHEMSGFEKPKHPLISVVEGMQMKKDPKMIGRRISIDLYMIALKGASCGLMYGRKYYDFAEGVLVFTAPHQVITITEDGIQEDSDKGWKLLFHPDLIRKSALGNFIDNYTFFSYESHEALHLSEEEKEILVDCLNKIKREYNQRIDKHSQRVMVSSLELLLNYCDRFYERQFYTRSTQNKEIVSQINQILKEYFKSGRLTEFGIPSVQYFAEQVHLSANYLSDLLKKETGRSAKDHINDFLVDKAKNMLINTEESVSEIAYHLGFNYPHYFSRLFKTKTGLSPQEYRTSN